MKIKMTIALMGLSLILANCGGYEYMPDMNYSLAVDAQEVDKTTGKVGNLLPPEGSIAYQASVYPNILWGLNGLEQAKDIPVPATINTKAGKEQYRINCSHCHGAEGNGGGKVGIKFPGAAAITYTSKTLPEVYHYVTTGGAIMPSHASQISEENRWAIAWYVKNVLQAPK